MLLPICMEQKLANCSARLMAKQKPKKKKKNQRTKQNRKTTKKTNQKTADTPLKLVKMFTEACSLHGREPGTKITEKKLVNFQQGNVSA